MRPVNSTMMKLRLPVSVTGRSGAVFAAGRLLSACVSSCFSIHHSLETYQCQNPSYPACVHGRGNVTSAFAAGQSPAKSSYWLAGVNLAPKPNRDSFASSKNPSYASCSAGDYWPLPSLVASATRRVVVFFLCIRDLPLAVLPTACSFGRCCPGGRAGCLSFPSGRRAAAARRQSRPARIPSTASVAVVEGYCQPSHVFIRAGRYTGMARFRFPVAWNRGGRLFPSRRYGRLALFTITGDERC